MRLHKNADTPSAEGDAEPTRHRLDLLGNRTINSVLYVMSVTQSRYHQPARDYLERKRSEGHSAKEARRAHKTVLGRRIIRRMWTDRRRQLDHPTVPRQEGGRISARSKVGMVGVARPRCTSRGRFQDSASCGLIVLNSIRNSSAWLVRSSTSRMSSR